MVRHAMTVSILGILLLLAGCSGYRELSGPWSSVSNEGDFGSPSIIRVGDKLRLTTVDKSVAEGLLVEIDEQSLMIAVGSAKPQYLLVSFEKIIQLEVYQSGSRVGLSKVAFVAAASSFIYLVIKSNSGATFSPSDEGTAKFYGE